MGNYKEASDFQNKPKQATRANYAPDPQTPIIDTTSQMKVSSKIEITITRQQLIEAKWLFNQSCQSKPNWLRQKFNIDQRRRKCLNTALMEAQLDSAFCDRHQNTQEWYDLLHLLWHEINGEPSCI